MKPAAVSNAVDEARDDAPLAVRRWDPGGPSSGHVYRTSHGGHLDAEDEVLVRLVRAGTDRQAAGVIFDRYAPLVRRILLRTLGPFHEVEDHVQETFIAFFRQVASLKSDDALRAFLVSVAVRVARHELRRRRVRRILRFAPLEELSDFADASGGALGQDMDGREAVRRLFAILDELDATSRLAFTLRFLEEMELMEVAVAIGESLASVKRRLARVVPIVNARAAADAALSPYLEEARRHG